MKKRVFIIHGWTLSPDKYWLPWLKKELEKRDYEVIVPLMPNTMNPTSQFWLSHLQKAVDKTGQETFFVGHSLGCIAILRFLESLKENQKVGGAVLVAGFGEDLEYDGYKGEVSSFFKTPLDWQKIRKTCKKFVVINSKDDPWVLVKNNSLFCDKLGADSIIVDKMGHFGMTELPLVLDEVLKISNL